MALDKQNVWQLPAQRTSWNSSFLCVLLGLKTYCWEPNLWMTKYVQFMWNTCDLFWHVKHSVKEKPAFRYQTSLNLFMWKFLWIYGELFLFACIAVMQCFLQTLEHFCSTMLKIWHVDAWTLNFKFILSA